jgi:hypothetical protein
LVQQVKLGPLELGKLGLREKLERQEKLAQPAQRVKLAPLERQGQEKLERQEKLALQAKLAPLELAKLEQQG